MVVAGRGVTRWGFCVLVVAGLLGASCSGSSDSTQPTSLPETTAPSATSALPSTTAPPQTTPAPTTASSVTAPAVTATTLPVPSLVNVAIATSDFNTCSVRSDGSVYCWGNNYIGQLGNGTRVNSSEPVMVEGITDGVSVVAAREHYCVLHRDGKVSCWGRNKSGNLGNGTFVDSNIPVSVSGISDAVALSAGYSQTCALHTDGSISCWGLNRFGEFGNGKSGREDELHSIPVKTLNITDAISITTGLNHTCALHPDRTISCWGHNKYGQLGNGSSVDSSVPTKVLGINDAIAIAAGSDYTCAIHQSRTISCWGENYGGQLGNGETKNTSPVPVKVLGIDDAVSLVQSPSLYLCAFRSNSKITCWGINKHTMLAPGNREPPFYDLPGTQDRKIWSWNGRGEEEFFELPNSQDITTLSLSRWHICAILKDATIHCWGPNANRSDDTIAIP